MMKKLLRSTLILLIGIVTLVVNGCKKEGPAGPAGNANVVSRTYPISAWSYSSPSYYTDLNVGELTSSNINTAAIMVYFSTGGDWVALPFTQYNSPYNYLMGFSTNISTVRVTWTYDYSLSTGNNPNTYYSTNPLQFKVVVIPPAVRKANADLDLNNYEAIKNRFNLTESKNQ